MIDWALYMTFIGFAVSAGFTPGPNNFMLMSSSALFGFRPTIPHILGIAVGFSLVVLAAIFGLGAVIIQFPWLLTVVKAAGAAWLAWLGFKFFRAALKLHQSKDTTQQSISSTEPENNRSRPFRFYEAVLFQWVNPKGLIMAMAAAGAYVGLSEDFAVRTLLISGTFIIVSLASASTWAVGGAALNRLMSQGRSAVILNFIMGLLLVATAYFILTAHT